MRFTAARVDFAHLCGLLTIRANARRAERRTS
jgi:hypothetical protein